MNTKTPAMYLMEFAVKKKIAPPEYSLIYSNMGTHVNEFKYQVNVGGVLATGSGRSKQVAKHEAAHNAIEALKEKGILDIGENADVNFKANLHRNEPEDSNFVNFIGMLQDKCLENKLPPPIFREVSDLGPSHSRNFTHECLLSSLKTQATAATKKQAKQLAAKLMLEKMEKILPDIISSTENDLKSIKNANERVQELYETLGHYNSTENKSTHVKEPKNKLLSTMKEKELSISDFPELSDPGTEENLKKILDKLGLEYEFITLPECNNMVIFNIKNDSFTLIECGKQEGTMKNSLVEKAFKLIGVFLRAK